MKRTLHVSVHAQMSATYNDKERGTWHADWHKRVKSRCLPSESENQKHCHVVRDDLQPFKIKTNRRLRLLLITELHNGETTSVCRHGKSNCTK
jgi:hypothetical protein